MASTPHWRDLSHDTICLVLRFRHSTTIRLTREEWWSFEDNRPNWRKMVRFLYGYLTNDPNRSIFLVWVNLNFINIDFAKYRHIQTMSPWKHVVSYRFVNDNERQMLPLDELDKRVMVNYFEETKNNVLAKFDYSHLPTVMSTALDSNIEYSYQKSFISFNLSYTGIELAGIEALFRTTIYLQFLDMYGTMRFDLSNGGTITNYFCRNCNFKKIRMCLNHLGTEAASHLAFKCKNLFSLYLNITSCDDGVLDILFQNPCLKELTFMVHNGSLPEHELFHLPLDFKGGIQRLEMSDTEISIMQCSRLVFMQPHLIKLQLHGCNLTNDHIHALFGWQFRSDSLIENGIVEIGLSGNQFDIYALQMICNACSICSDIVLDDNDGLLAEEAVEALEQIDAYEGINFTFI